MLILTVRCKFTLYIRQFYVQNSAKVTAPKEITPQSNYVSIVNNGRCYWRPRFDHSVAHCRIDTTWFPFDEQTCKLVFESWLLPEAILKFSTYGRMVDKRRFLQPAGWHVIGNCVIRHSKILLRCGLLQLTHRAFIFVDLAILDII